jgi:ABC-type multidrug transport system ATPase subunit
MARPTSGQAHVLGLPVNFREASVEIPRRTGFVSEDKGLFDYMTVEQMIRFTAERRGRADSRRGSRLEPGVGGRGSGDAQRNLFRGGCGGGVTCFVEGVCG